MHIPSTSSSHRRPDTPKRRLSSYLESLACSPVWRQSFLAAISLLHSLVDMEAATAVPSLAAEVTYLCGGESALCFFSFVFLLLSYVFLACGTPNGIKPQDPIRCRNCGYRILYKIRTKKCKFPKVILKFCHAQILVSLLQ